MKTGTLNTHDEVHETEEPCDAERLKVLEDAMREAIAAYMLDIDPHNRVSRAEFMDRVIEILDRRKVADAANVEDSAPPAADTERPRWPHSSTH
jgi:hypothetical protein